MIRKCRYTPMVALASIVTFAIVTSESARADLAPCKAVSAGAETTSNAVANVGQTVIGRASGRDVQMHAGILPCLTLPPVGPGAPQMTLAVSRRTHGLTSFDLSLNLTNPATVEPRQNGAAPTVIIVFSGNIEAADGSADCGDEVVVNNGTCNSVVVASNRLVVNADFDVNACVTVKFTGLRAAGGGPDVIGDNDVDILAHTGNVDGNAAVNILDLQAIKNRLIQPVNNATFLFDVNVTGGAINILDLQVTKNNLFQPAACP